MELNVSITGLTIQCSGVLLITVLSFFMTRFIRRTSLFYWTIAWVSLSISLIALSIGFQVPQGYDYPFFFLYYLGEYTYSFFIYAGCRKYAANRELSRRDLKYLIPFVLLSIILAAIPTHYNVKFIPHFAAIALMFWLSYRIFRKVRRPEQPVPGLRVMKLALLLLTLDYAHYVPIFSLVLTYKIEVLMSYMGFTSIYDLILEMLLGFGIVMVVLEDLQHEVVETNRKLLIAQERLENLVRLDPLTEVLNRHAFYSLLDSRETNPTHTVFGCAVIVDIDNLKPINDRLGHSAGDAAIRKVAQALRSVIRADDMLFRWGGDEFMMLLFNTTEETARNRLSEISTSLLSHLLNDATNDAEIHFSYGVAAFSQMSDLEKAIDEADAAMYNNKQTHKDSVTT
jgi:diguanylate cyclase (GGDEF)-like protein